MIVKTVKLPRTLALSLARAAKARGCSESELIRQGIQRVAGESSGLDMRQLIGADLGAGSGPADLSSNRKYRARYGRSRHR
jgi:hypothetical protein